jgi:hypothetical protein
MLASLVIFFFVLHVLGIGVLVLEDKWGVLSHQLLLNLESVLVVRYLVVLAILTDFRRAVLV